MECHHRVDLTLLFVIQVRTENNVLRDGTLIDLCGATLLWRSAVGLLSAPVRISNLLSETNLVYKLYRFIVIQHLFVKVSTAVTSSSK